MGTRWFTFIQNPDTFKVEEELPYALCGTGPFCFVQIEKRNLSTAQLKRAVSEQTGVPMRFIRHAGLKDRLSTSSQWLCWERKKQRSPLKDGPGFVVLRTEAHDRTLHVGQVGKNNFRVTLRIPEEEQGNVSSLFPKRFPNFFGLQRFSGFTPENPPWPTAKDRFVISQYQAAIFNLYLRERFKSHGFDLFPDDLFTRSHGRRVFKVEDLNELETEGDDRPPAIPTGPIPGYKMSASKDPLEIAFFQKRGLDLEDFRSFGKIAMGTRRPLWVIPELHHIKQTDSGTELSFSLPGGCYATTLLSYMLDPEFHTVPMRNWPGFEAPRSPELPPGAST